MTTMGNMASHVFIWFLVSVKIPKDVVARVILEYNTVHDPINHINKHDTSLLGRTCDDDHTTLLFPSTLSSSTFSYFFELLMHPVNS